MSYLVNLPCAHYNDEWDELVHYINNDSSWSAVRSDLGELVYPIEAKALQIISIGRRVTKAVSELGEYHNNQWREIFVESLILLFPMLELIGHARLGEGGSNASLYAGIEWLSNVENLPARVEHANVIMRDTSIIYALNSRPSIRDVFSIRQYFLHGLKSPATAQNLANQTMADILNFQLPEEIVALARRRLHDYWEQLKSDDGGHGWVMRLSHADIYPFIVSGSGRYDHGLIDHDIIYCLSGWKTDANIR